MNIFLIELAEMEQPPYGKHPVCERVYAGVCGGFFSVTICVLIHGENVECKRLPVSSTIGLDMLCRLFFLSFCSPLTKIDF